MKIKKKNEGASLAEPRDRATTGSAIAPVAKKRPSPPDPLRADAHRIGTPPLAKWDCVHVSPAQRSQIERLANMMHRQTCIPEWACKTIIYDGSTVLDSLAQKTTDWQMDLTLLPFHVFMRRLRVTVAIAIGAARAKRSGPTKEGGTGAKRGPKASPK